MSTDDTLAQAAERAPAYAWTGRQLLAWLQNHPQWLDRPVHLLVMPEAEEDGYLTGVDEDAFEEQGPDVISLTSWPEHPIPAAAPAPAVDRAGLTEFIRRALSQAILADVPDAAEFVADQFLKGGFAGQLRMMQVERDSLARALAVIEDWKYGAQKFDAGLSRDLFLSRADELIASGLVRGPSGEGGESQ